MKLGVMVVEIFSKTVEAELDWDQSLSSTSEGVAVVETVVELSHRTSGWCILCVLVVLVGKINAFDSGGNGEGW